MHFPKAKSREISSTGDTQTKLQIGLRPIGDQVQMVRYMLIHVALENRTAAGRCVQT